MSSPVFPLAAADPKTLAAARVLHTRCLCRLEWFAEQQGILLAAGEGYVQLQRKGNPAGKIGSYMPFIDRVHMNNSVHYSGLARDHVVYRADAAGVLHPVTDGGDPVWKKLGEFWLGLHPLCRWGGNFTTVDSNHFSLVWQGYQ